jgi:hypothetical protein
VKIEGENGETHGERNIDKRRLIEEDASVNKKVRCEI